MKKNNLIALMAVVFVAMSAVSSAYASDVMKSDKVKKHEKHAHAEAKKWDKKAAEVKTGVSVKS